MFTFSLTTITTTNGYFIFKLLLYTLVEYNFKISYSFILKTNYINIGICIIQIDLQVILQIIKQFISLYDGNKPLYNQENMFLRTPKVIDKVTIKFNKKYTF